MRRAVVFIGVAGVIGTGVSCEATQTDSKSKELKKMEQRQQISEDAKELLRSLNYWVTNGGDPEHPLDSVKSQGEANARVQNLKEQIADLNLKIEWNGNEYVFVTK